MIVRGKFSGDSAAEEFYIKTISGDIIIIDPPEPMPKFERTIECLIKDNKLLDWQYDLTTISEEEKIDKTILAAYGTFEEPTEEDWDYAYEKSQQLANEYRRITHGTYNIKALHVAHQGAGSSWYTVPWGKISSAVRETYPEGTYWTYTSAIAQSNRVFSGICGQAIIGGRQSFSKSDCVDRKDTHFHETIGHSILGIGHDGKAGGGEYSGFGSIMGSSRTSGGNYDYNTPHLYHAGLIEDNNIIELLPGQSTSTWLVQGSDDPLSLRLGENKMVLCKIANNNLTKLVAVSYYNGQVQTHEPGHHMSTSFSKTGKLEQTRHRKAMEVDGGVTVIVHEFGNGCASVTVSNNTDQHAEVAPEPSWYHPDSTTASPQWGDWCRGQWGNKEWSVQGVHVGMTQDGRPVLHWLTWDWRNRGEQKWYWAVCETDGYLASGTIHTVDRNGFPEPVGYLEAYWYTEDQGIMRCYIGNQRYAVPMERVFKADANPDSGYYGIGNGEGLTVSMNENNHTLCYWLRFSAGTKYWYMLIGQKNDMTIYEVSGGQKCVKSDFKINPIGTASINNGSFEYRLDDGEEESRQMRRLA